MGAPRENSHMEKSEYFSEQVLRWQGLPANSEPEENASSWEDAPEDNDNGYEELIIKDRKPVGITATIDVKAGTVTATDVSSSSAVPSSEEDRDHILKAGRCTSLILVEYGGHVICGTAFFVDGGILITAGHVVRNATKPGARIISSIPGKRFVDVSKLRTGQTKGLHCKVKETLFHLKSQEYDIAILECGLFYSNYLTICQDELTIGTVVDVIGYPGPVREDWFTKHQHELDNTNTSKLLAERLLPPSTLMVSRGEVLSSTNTHVTYYLSSVEGMSGASATLKDGKAYGLHVGQPAGSMPTAVLFSEPVISKFLKKHNLIK